LIAANYPRAEVWAMTPREIAASLYLAERRRKRQAAEQLALSSLAARGDARALRKQINELQRGCALRLFVSTTRLPTFNHSASPRPGLGTDSQLGCYRRQIRGR
jgi:hypothetical protein